MRVTKRHTAGIVVIAGAAMTFGFAPVASAAPECVQTAPYTTQCRTNGSTAINTSPNPNNQNFGPWGPGYGYGYGIPIFGWW